VPAELVATTSGLPSPFRSAVAIEVEVGPLIG
jgi:hypothetical protein